MNFITLPLIIIPLCMQSTPPLYTPPMPKSQSYRSRATRLPRETRRYPRHARGDEPDERHPGYSRNGEPFESTIQRDIVKYLRKERPEILFTSTVGGVNVRPYERRKMLDQGYSKGVPDMLIFLKEKVWGVEVKRPRTFRITAEQIQWEKDLTERGHLHSYVHSLEDFKTHLEIIQRTTHLIECSDKDEAESGEVELTTIQLDVDSDVAE